MKRVVTAVLVLGFATAAASSGNAAAVPPMAGIGALAAPTDAFQQVQYERGGAVVVAPRAVAPRAVAPRGTYVVRPGYVGPRVGVVGRPAVVGRAAFVRPYRPWFHRAHFGTIVGGVALGAIVTVAVIGVAPAYAPAPGLCWYWADPSMVTGYWDYCGY